MSKPSKGKATTDRPVIKLGSPYTETKWPIISASQQDTILQLLVDLVNPVGQHRLDHVVRSNGKRTKKRKRPASEEKSKASRAADVPESACDGHRKHDAAGSEDAKPPPPAISEHIIVGYNSVIRHLEGHIKSNPSEDKTQSSIKPLSAIYLTHSPTTYLPYQHLPALIATASNKRDASTSSSTPPTTFNPIILVPLPTSTAEDRLASALGIARVGMIGVFLDAPGANALLEYTMENVSETQVPWLQEAGEAKWLGANIVIEDGRKS